MIRKSTVLLVLTFASAITYACNYGKATSLLYHIEIIMLACTYFIVKQLEENKNPV